jgi:hypothetical protein
VQVLASNRLSHYYFFLERETDDAEGIWCRCFIGIASGEYAGFRCTGY